MEDPDAASGSDVDFDVDVKNGDSFNCDAEDSSMSMSNGGSESIDINGDGGITNGLLMAAFFVFVLVDLAKSVLTLLPLPA